MDMRMELFLTRLRAHTALLPPTPAIQDRELAVSQAMGHVFEWDFYHAKPPQS